MLTFKIFTYTKSINRSVCLNNTPISQDVVYYEFVNIDGSLLDLLNRKKRCGYVCNKSV